MPDVPVLCTTHHTALTHPPTHTHTLMLTRPPAIDHTQIELGNVPRACEPGEQSKIKCRISTATQRNANAMQLQRPYFPGKTHTPGN